MDELKKILHKILHVAAGEDGQKVIHDEIDALAEPAPEAPAPAPSEPEPVPEPEPVSSDPAPDEAFPVAPEPFGTESAPGASDGTE